MVTSTVEIAEILSSRGYHIESELGFGREGRVFLCRSDRDSELYAVKVSQAGVCSMQEVEALTCVWNPHVITIWETFVADEFLFQVLEYCPGGSLHELREYGHLPDKRLLRICYQVLLAVRACHDRGVAHLDIKPQNILIDRHGRAKLADFGLSLIPGGGRVSGARGTWAFMAPEVGNGHPYDPFKADIWSLGITFFYAAVGGLPWYGRAQGMINPRERAVCFVPDTVPAPLAEILRCLIRVDPHARPTIAKLLQNPGWDLRAGRPYLGRRLVLVNSRSSTIRRRDGTLRVFGNIA
jgi:serine/threonine protein kinase